MYYLSGKSLFRQMALANIDAPELSEATGIRRARLSECLAGRSMLVDAWTVRRLAFFLDCEMEDLLDGKSFPGT